MNVSMKAHYTVVFMVRLTEGTVAKLLCACLLVLMHEEVDVHRHQISRRVVPPHNRVAAVSPPGNENNDVVIRRLG